MIKKLLKKLFHKIYLIGYYENSRVAEIRRLNDFRAISTFPKNVVFGNTARIHNHRAKNDILIGDKSIILGQLITFQHGGRIEIGECVFLGEGTRVWSAMNIKIGDRVLIAYNVNIHDSVSHPSDPVLRHQEFLYTYENHIPMPNNSLSAKEVVIGNDVWIGFNVTILKGVRIGDKAIIGANTLITKDVPEGAVVVGPEQRILRYI